MTLLIPINDQPTPDLASHHWFALHVDVDARSVLILDSLRKDRDVYRKWTDPLCKWLNELFSTQHNTQLGADANWVKVDMTMPQQQGGTQCGVFACMAARSCAFGTELSSLTTDIAASSLRAIMACELRATALVGHELESHP